MNSRIRRLAILLPLAGTIWITGLIPWPGVLGYLEPAKPTILTVAFALTTHRLGVASWPLVVSFSLTFFIYSFAMFYFSRDASYVDESIAGGSARLAASYFVAVIFSPITLWCPLLFGCGSYALARRLWSTNRLERSRA